MSLNKSESFTHHFKINKIIFSPFCFDCESVFSSLLIPLHSPRTQHLHSVWQKASLTVALHWHSIDVGFPSVDWHSSQYTFLLCHFTIKCALLACPRGSPLPSFTLLNTGQMVCYPASLPALSPCFLWCFPSPGGSPSTCLTLMSLSVLFAVLPSPYPS